MALAMTLMATDQQRTSLGGARGQHDEEDDHARMIEKAIEETGEEAKLKRTGTKKRGGAESNLMGPRTHILCFVQGPPRPLPLS